MSKRYGSVCLRCKFPGCTETSFLNPDSRDGFDEAIEIQKKWLCQRHIHPDEVLGSERTTITTTYEVMTSGNAPGLYWGINGRASSGFIHGPGFKGWANDFPEGTTLTISAELSIKGIEIEETVEDKQNIAHALLKLTNVGEVAIEVIAAWPVETIEAVSDWASAIHASNGEPDAVIPETPAVIQQILDDMNGIEPPEDGPEISPNETQTNSAS